MVSGDTDTHARPYKRTRTLKCGRARTFASAASLEADLLLDGATWRSQSASCHIGFDDLLLFLFLLVLGTSPVAMVTPQAVARARLRSDAMVCSLEVVSPATTGWRCSTTLNGRALVWFFYGVELCFTSGCWRKMFVF